MTAPGLLPHSHPPPHPAAADATLLHLRWAMDWRPPATGAPSRGDLSVSAATARYLRAEGRADPERAARLLDAAAEVDRLAAGGVLPQWEALQAVQVVVLGAPAPFRAGAAHGRGRVMGYAPWLPARFAAKLRHDAADGVEAVAAGVRLYLDLIHVHPFADGNARAARLGLGWWLRLHRLPVPALEPLVRCPKPPGADPRPLLALLCA